MDKNRFIKIQTRCRNQRKIQVNGRLYSVGKFLKSAELKKNFVNENPYNAEQFYYLSRDKELGEIFAKTYNNHQEYGVSAYHIGQELGLLCIEKPQNHVREVADSVEVNVFDTKSWIRKIMSKK